MAENENKLMRNEISRLKQLVETLQDENERLVNKVNTLSRENALYRGHYSLNSTISNIYRILASYKDTSDTLMNEVLNIIANSLRAEQAILFRLEDKNFISIYTADDVNSEKDEFYKEVFRDKCENLNFSSLFPIESKEILSSKEKNITIIENCDLKNMTCNSAGINTIAAMPVYINEDYPEYIIGVINPSVNKDCRLLLEPCSNIFSQAIKLLNLIKEKSKLAATDNFTGLYDRGYFMKKCNELNREQPNSVTMIMVDLFRLKYVNDNFSHEAGDKYILAVAELLKSYFPNDIVYRYGGDEFGVIIINKSPDYAENLMDALASELENMDITDRFGNKITARVDYGIEYEDGFIDCDDITHRADIKMNENKARYYQEHGINRRK